MADNIDKQFSVKLPNSSSNVHVQLVESRPERVDYKIDLVDSNQAITHVVPKDFYLLPTLHDLWKPANALAGYRMACVGLVGFVVDGSWDLECQIIVDGKVVARSSGTVTGTAGNMNFFRFICNFT
jgi:hypothetical protein